MDTHAVKDNRRSLMMNAQALRAEATFQDWGSPLIPTGSV